MPKTYADIQKQIQLLQKQADEARRREIAGVVGRIKEAIAFYELTPRDLGFAEAGVRVSSRVRHGAPKRTSGGPRFADGAGNTWSGRGPRPRWIKEALSSGKALEEFAVSSTQDAGGASLKQGATARKRASYKVAAKFRDQAGNSWSGRGSRPRWLKEALAKGESLESFAVQK